MPVIKIDGRELEAGEGRTVLEAARAAGIYVPSLCYHPKVGQSGLCRICVVEIEGARGLVTACNTPVREGMVVTTASESVIEARKMIVELLLADGVHDCLSCEMCGTCELQEAAYRLGIMKPSLPRVGDPQPMDLSHPMIIRNPNKCIQCWRCIKGCNAVVVNEVLDMGFRGHRSVVIADQNVPLGESSCLSCGECVQLCPTGALVEKKSKGRGRTWDLAKVRTTCPYCGVGCQMDMHVDPVANRIVKVTGAEGAPPNDGMLCVKGRFAYDYPSSPRRLVKPLIKRNGVHVEASWDEALDHTARCLGEIKRKHGPDAIGGVGCAKDTNENNYATMKFMRAVIGTNNLDHCARL
jgi:predicted molibdopterin-dependent oxidoreductase YjgC